MNPPCQSNPVPRRKPAERGAMIACTGESQPSILKSVAQGWSYYPCLICTERVRSLDGMLPRAPKCRGT